MNRALFAAALLVACNNPDAQTAAPDAGATTPKAPPPPFTGTLTGERVMGAKGLVHPLEAWTDALPSLEGQMGKATLVKEDKRFLWGASQGDDCFYIEVEKQADGKVGMVMEPMKVSKGGAIMSWDDCLSAAGVRKQAVEDPSATPPPTDGKPITVLALLDGAKKARSKWTGAKVTVSGLYMNTTNLQSNGVPLANVAITAAKADLANVIQCSLTDALSAPSTMRQYAPITVTGTVKVNDMITGGGERVLDVDLDACSIGKTSK